MINATAEYALRAVVYLATCGDEPTNRDTIAQQTQIPANYLVRVLMSLDAAKIVSCRRGPGGGYRLERSLDQLTAYDVIQAVSALPRIEACPLGIPEHVKLCPLHARLDEVARLAEAAYRATLIAELVPNQRRKKFACVFPLDSESMM